MPVVARGGFSVARPSSITSVKTSTPPSSTGKTTTSLSAAPKADPTVVKHVTINKSYDVHHSGGASGDGLLTGMMLGHMMTDNRPAQAAPVIINGGHQVQTPPATAQTVIQSAPAYAESYVQHSGGLGFFGWSVVMLVLGIVGWSICKVVTR